jgi:hypothetical protein
MFAFGFTAKAVFRLPSTLNQRNPMPEIARPEGTPEPPMALVSAIVVASCLAGGTLVLFDQEIVIAILTQLLNPGSNTFYTAAQSAGGPYRFRFELFSAGSMFIAIPLTVAWFASAGYKQYLRTVVFLFVASVLVSSAAFFVYWHYMQVQLTDIRMGGQLQPPRSRGSWTPLEEVPIAMLTLSGPLLASAFVLMRRRRIGQAALGPQPPAK